MLKKNNEGYFYQSEIKEYDLLEGVSIGGERRYTSDMLFIVDNRDIEKPVQVVGVLYGAFQLEEENKDRDYYIELISNLVEEYEKKQNLI